MPSETSTLATTGLIFGGTTLIILFFPFALYLKHFFTRERDNTKPIIEIVIYAFVLQFALGVFFSLFVFIANSVIIKPDLKPSYGIQYFYGKIYPYNGEKTANTLPVFWDNWIGKSAIAENDNTYYNDAQSLNALINWYKILSILLYSVFALTPMFILFLFFFIIYRMEQNEQEIMRHESGVVVKIFRAFGVYFMLIFILFLHFLVASGTVMVAGKFGTTDFSFYQYIATIWHNIIFGVQK